MANVIKFDEKMKKGLVKYLKDEKQVEFDVDEDDFNDQEAVIEVIQGAFEFFGITLGEIKSEEEPVTLSLPGYIDMTVSYRDGGTGEGNFGVGATFGEEIKKRIKDDELLDDLSNDGDDE